MLTLENVKEIVMHCAEELKKSDSTTLYHQHENELLEIAIATHGRDIKFVSNPHTIRFDGNFVYIVVGEVKEKSNYRDFPVVERIDLDDGTMRMFISVPSKNALTKLGETSAMYTLATMIRNIIFNGYGSTRDKGGLEYIRYELMLMCLLERFLKHVFEWDTVKKIYNDIFDEVNVLKSYHVDGITTIEKLDILLDGGMSFDQLFGTVNWMVNVVFKEEEQEE